MLRAPVFVLKLWATGFLGGPLVCLFRVSVESDLIVVCGGMGAQTENGHYRISDHGRSPIVLDPVTLLLFP